MNIEYYRNFISIVEAGSISAAAKQVSIAQPALSNQMKILQKQFGVPLLRIRRGGHAIELTEAGRVLYEKAKHICATEDSMMREIASASAGFSGTLRLSLSPSMALAFIEKYLGPFSRLYPKINYELHEVTMALQIQQLLSGQAEIGVANAPLRQSSRFEVIYRRREGLTALFNKESPYLHGDEPQILLHGLAAAPLCLSRGCSELFLSVCRESQIIPKVLSINTTKLSTIAWAAGNMGVAVVPADWYEVFADYLVPKEIKDDRLFVEQTVFVVKGRPLSTVARLFVNFFIKHSLHFQQG